MKRLGLIFGVLAAIVILIALMLPFLINKEAIIAQVTDIIKKSTGSDPVVMGDASVSFFPVPKVTMTQVGIRNAPGALTPYIIQLKAIEIYPAMQDVFSSAPHISKLVLTDPIFDIEKMPDGRLNWAVAFSGAKSMYQSLFNLSKLKELALPDVHISDGIVHYTSDAKAKRSTYQDVQGTFLHDSGGMRLDVNGIYHKIPMAVLANISLTDGNADSPFDLKMSAANHEIALKGKFKQVADDVEVEGDINCKTDSFFDLVALIQDKQEVKKDPSTAPLPAPGQENAPAQPAPVAPPVSKLPISISSTFHHTLKTYEWKNIQLDSEFIKAHADLTSNPSEKSSSLILNLEHVDIDAMKASGMLALLKQDKPATEEQKVGVGEQGMRGSLLGLADDESMTVKLDAKHIVVNKQVLAGATLEGEVSGPFADVSSAKVMLPGDSQALFVGTVKQGFQGITYEGTLDAWGQDFTALMPLFTVDQNFFPKTDFKRFRLKSEQFVISPVEARLIESRLQIENMLFGGTVVANYSDTMKVQSKLVAANVNIDNLIAQHASVFSATGDRPVYLGLPAAISEWLKTINSEHGTKLVLQNFTFNNVLRPAAEMELIITPTKFNLAKLSMQYDSTHFDVGLSVENVAGQTLPKYGISLSADQLNIAGPAATSAAAPAAEGATLAAAVTEAEPVILPDGWSKQEYDVSWLDDIDLAFDVKVKKLNYGTWLLNNFSAKGSAANRTLTLDPMRANIWGADLAAKGTLSGGKLPILSLALSLNNIAIEQLKQVTPLFSSISGKFNVTAALSSSGISPYFMASNMTGKVGIAGRDIKVQGFNLRGIVRSVSAVRSIADILNVVRLAFPGGDTLIDTVQGNFSITKGRAQTLGIALSTNESKGIIKSVLDLVSWKMDTEIGFELATLDKEHPPTLKILFNGDLENPKKGLDTKSLEEFVALKTKEKYLQDIPSLQ